jgi:hypothetical protein
LAPPTIPPALNDASSALGANGFIFLHEFFLGTHIARRCCNGNFARQECLPEEREMKRIALALALAFGTTVAIAAEEARKETPQATGDKPVTTSPTPQQGQPAGSSVGDPNAGAFWTEHARGGYMSKDQAMKYKGPGGKTVDFKKLDTDADSRVSQSEWENYHKAFAQKEGGPKEAGAAGPAGADAPKPDAPKPSTR